MKLPVTQKIVEQVLREAHEGGRLSSVDGWAFDPSAAGRFSGTRFAGCAVGNILYAASGRRSGARRIGNVSEQVVYATGCDIDPTFRNHTDVFVARGNMLGAISCIFESTYDATDESLDKTIAKIREHLPARFSIDIDGLRAMPTWRKKKAKRGKS